MDGAVGGPEGVIGELAVEYEPDPFELVATTWNSYAVEFVRPVIVQVTLVPEQEEFVQDEYGLTAY
jgi:hypothetical protein